MKIKETELDESIQRKLRYLDNIILTFEDGKTSYLGFDGNKFINRYVDDSLLKKITSNGDIFDISESIGDFNCKKYDTNLTCKMNLNNVRNSLFKSLAVDEVPYAKINLKTKIINLKYLKDDILICSEGGCLYRINRASRECSFSINFVETVKSKFAVKDFYPHDILDINIYEDKLIVSTLSNGVFLLKNQTEIENIIPESGISSFEILKDKLFGIVPRDENNVLVYDLKTGKRLEVFNQLRRHHQVPVRLRKVGKKIFVLGKNFDKNDCSSILHCWMLDEAENGFNNIDYKIPQLQEKDHMIPKFIESNEESLFLAAFKNEKLVVYKYSVMQLSRQPEIKVFSLKGLDYSDADSIFLEDGIVSAIFGNKLIVNSTKGIEKIINLEIKRNSHLFIDSNSIYCYGNGVIYEFKNNEYSFNSSLSICIFKEEKTCNNIEVFLKGIIPTLKYAFINLATKEVKPDIAIPTKEGIYFKFLNYPNKELFLNLTATQSDSIEGISVFKNHIYYRGD